MESRKPRFRLRRRLSRGAQRPIWRKAFATRVACAGLLLAVVFASAVFFALETTQAVTTVSVRSFGAKGDGRTDDTKAFRIAMSAAVKAHATLFVPRGTYKLSRLSLPNRLAIKGAGSSASWLKGRILFGSDQDISRLTLGDVGDSAVHNRDGASRTTFTSCRFRGGRPGAPDGYFATVALGDDGSCDHIAFRDCLVERNLGMGNNIGIVEDGGSQGGAHVSDITFDGCHIGVSNGASGRNIGSPRAGIEMYCSPTGGAQAYHGWSNIIIRDCILEATNSFCVDLADYPLVSDPTTHAASGVLISGCTIMGGGYDGGVFGYSIEMEAPRDVVIENNTIYRSSESAVNCGSGIGTMMNYIIRNNIIDYTYDNGIYPDASIYHTLSKLGGNGPTITGNTFRVNSSGPPLMIDNMANATITGNTFIEERSSGVAWALVYKNSDHITFTGNTLTSASTNDPVLWNAGNNANVTIAPNTFPHN